MQERDWGIGAVGLESAAAQFEEREDDRRVCRISQCPRRRRCKGAVAQRLHRAHGAADLQKRPRPSERARKPARDQTGGEPARKRVCAGACVGERIEAGKATGVEHEVVANGWPKP